MEKQETKKTVPLKAGWAIKILAILGLLFIAIYCSIYQYHDGNFIFLLHFNFRQMFFNLIHLIPGILFIVYIFKAYKNLRASILMPIVFGLIVVQQIYDIVMWFDNIFFIEERCFMYTYDAYMEYASAYENFWYLVYSVSFWANCIVTICFILAIICALKGFNNKYLIIILLSLSLLCLVFDMSGARNYMRFFGVSFCFFNVFSYYIGQILLCVAFLLFGAKNRIKPILKPKKAENIKINTQNTGKALKELKNMLDFGMITEEEYQAQRAEIIKKL